jgi:CDP-diacylglycerol---serine O-phosphatidyltransferase
MKRVYLVPNIVTAFSLACGLFVIFKINMVEPGSGYYEVVLSSTVLLLVAALADFVDGALARALHAESEFGFLFDSMADSVSFGVAPSVLLLKTLSLEQGTFLSFFAATGCMIYSLCMVLRLVRFNVLAAQAKASRELASAHKKHFTGLPAPAGAAAALSVNLLLLSPVMQRWFAITETDRAIALSTLMIVIGYFLICRLKFPSMKVLHFRIPSFHLIFLTVVLVILFLYGILYYFPFVFAGVAWGYVCLALTFSLIRMIAGKKSKTLEEFEPEPEEDEEIK